MIKSKKQMYLVIGAFALVLMLGTVTYAFFNYTRTGVANRISVGRINFHTSQNGNINLTNIFPIDSSEATGENPNYDSVSIEIEGDTDYTGGVEYVVTATNVNLTVGNRQIPVTLDIDVGGLGTEETGDYYTNRDNYSVSKYKLEYSGELEEDSHILVGYIAPNTTGNIDGISGTINIKAYLNKDKIKISDTYDGNETDNMGTTNEWVGSSVVLTTNEWNSLQNSGLSFKIKVEANEGIWVEDPMILQRIITRKASTVSYIANYDDLVSSNANYSSYTTQDQVSTSSPKQTVYYYTGADAKENSNVLFGGYCWQIVRTTDNGGIRMIYNGVAQKDVTLTIETISDTSITYTNDATYTYTYDSGTKKWTSTNHTDSATGTFVFTVNVSGDYALNYIVSSENGYDKAKFYKNNILIKEDSGTKEDSIELGILTTTDEIKVQYVKDSSTSSGNDNVIFEIAKVTNRVESDIPLCKTDREATIGINGRSDGQTYLSDIYGRTPATAFGRSFDYNLSTGEFTLVDGADLPTMWNSGDTNNNGIVDYDDLIGTYTCGSAATTCTELYYIAEYYDSDRAWLIKHTIEKASHYSQVGTSLFNSYDHSIAKTGYMFNEIYNSNYYNRSGTFYETATWDPDSSLYVLSGDSGSLSATRHYICNTPCNKVSYYHSSSAAYYVLLENGNTLEDIIYRMTGNGNDETKAKNGNYVLNKKNSSIKGIVDNWYKKNLINYGNYIDDGAVYCNDRSISDLGGWNPNGGIVIGDDADLKFNQYSSKPDLNCVNETDRFSVSNPKAKLTYPVGLLTESERNIMTDPYVAGAGFWTNSPSNLALSSRVNVVMPAGYNIGVDIVNTYGVRPVITLKSSTVINGGTGTYDSPYIVGPVVTREN